VLEQKEEGMLWNLSRGGKEGFVGRRRVGVLEEELGRIRVEEWVMEFTERINEEKLREMEDGDGMVRVS